MPSTRKQKAKEKRSRQSDVMSDIENLDVMLGRYQRDNIEMQEGNIDNEMDERLNRRKRQLNQNDSEFRSYLNTNLDENSGLTVETSRAISSEVSSQMSRKLAEMTCDLNTRILDAINTAIENRVLPSIRNAVGSQNSAKKKQIWTFGQMDRIRVILVKYIPRGTVGQMDSIRKMLAKWPMMLRQISPD